MNCNDVELKPPAHFYIVVWRLWQQCCKHTEKNRSYHSWKDSMAEQMPLPLKFPSKLTVLQMQSSIIVCIFEWSHKVTFRTLTCFVLYILLSAVTLLTPTPSTAVIDFFLNSQFRFSNQFEDILHYSVLYMLFSNSAENAPCNKKHG